MAGTARSRTLPPKYMDGTYVKNGGTFNRHVLAEGTARCDDVVGNTKNDNPLYVDKSKSNWCALQGNNGMTGLSYREYINYGPSISWPGYPGPSFGELTMTTLMLARANPGRSYLKLPVFIYELRELPKLVLHHGRSILRSGPANLNLAWQFGWLPLISDLRRMFNFQDAVAKRVNELERLQSKSGLKRRKHLKRWDDTYTSPSAVVIESTNSSVYAKYSDQYSKDCWGTCRFVPTPGAAMPKTDLERKTLAVKSLLGFGPGQITANIWEGLPWSWLIDWFSNVQDFIEATNNSVAMPTGKVCTMYKSLSSRIYTVTSKPGWVELSPAVAHVWRENKQRAVHAATPTVTWSLPFLTGRQLSILGSLWIQRR